MKRVTDRYRTLEGVVLRRRALPSGDLVVGILTPEGSIEALAKSAQRPGGRSGRIGLFYRIRFQVYRRPERALATLTQVALEEALAAQAPFRYAAQGFLAELAWHAVSPEIAGRGYSVLVSALRGVKAAEDPRVPLVWGGFRLLLHAGHAPAGAGTYLHLDGHLGREPGPGAVFLGEEGALALLAVLRRPGKEAIQQLAEAPLDRLLEALLRYAEAQLEGLKSVRPLRQLLSNAF